MVRANFKVLLFSLLWFAVPFLIASPAMASLSQDRDVTVVGKLKNTGSQPIDDPDDLIGHGWMTADIRVKRILQGRIARRILRIKYFAHTYLSEDKSFKFHLRLQEDGTYLVCAPSGSEGLRCD